MKTLYTTIIALILSIGSISAQVATTYYVTPYGSSDASGLRWWESVSSVDEVLAKNPSGNIIIMMQSGTYGPIKIFDQNNITHVKIYGGCSGMEINPPMVILDPTNPTIIDGNLYGEGKPAVSLETNFSNATTAYPIVVDGLTIRGEGYEESVAIRVINSIDAIFNRCRIEGSMGGGNLMFFEGIPDGSFIAITNSIIANNDVDRIVKSGFGVKFINTNIIDNYCTEFMNTYLWSYPDIYELKNCIVDNTSHETSGYHSLNVYYSVVEDFTYFIDYGNNYEGIDLPYSGDTYDPYNLIPNEYTSGGGNPNYLFSYGQQVLSSTDISNNERILMGVGMYVTDIGAYQGPLQASSPQRAPSSQDIEGTDIDLLGAVTMYPTSINSGETVYFESSFEAPLTAKVYNLNGVELYSTSISSSEEQVSITMPQGIYMVIITDDSTGNRLSTEKLQVK